ncbi:hypothetical protein C4569_02560 [Candidatus Parcubacteria bacterium]|nr:MAG: hypothetical protein C4569_02560 [Candidatus Parcubacteria bacterium]
MAQEIKFRNKVLYKVFSLILIFFLLNPIALATSGPSEDELGEKSGTSATSTPEITDIEKNSDAQDEIPPTPSMPELNDDLTTMTESLSGEVTSTSTEVTVVQEDAMQLEPDPGLENETAVNGSAGSSTDETLIDTGDAEIDIYANNTVNLNETDALDVAVENQNDGLATTTVSADGLSGSNDAEGGSGAASIVTGDVIVEANISNFINTNVSGTGEIFALDIYEEATGDLDISQETTNATLAISGSGVIDNSTKITNDNSADVFNEIDINADSGNNTAQGEGNVDIITGDVSVSANISNIINTNITGDGWKYSVINVFGKWFGDFVVPYSEGEGSGLKNNYLVQDQNDAEVENLINIVADSGNNVADGEESEITAGDSSAAAIIINEINTNIFGDDWDLVKINLFGTWGGKVFGLPENAAYYQTENELIIYNTKLENDFIDKVTSGTIEVYNNNEANLLNSVTVNANSGGNFASSTDGSATVITGDVDVNVNVFNQINTNLTGDKWNYSLINVFGSWLGNLEFGRPDLWIEEEILLSTLPVKSGDRVTYKIKFGNNGNGRADDVIVTDFYDFGQLNLTDTAGAVQKEDSLQWKIGELKPGDSKTLIVIKNLAENVKTNDGKITNKLTIFGKQDDRNPLDNEYTGSFSLSGAINSRTSKSITSYWPPYLSINNSHNATTTVSVGEKLAFTIKVLNSGGLSSYKTAVDSVLYDSAGKEIAQSKWELGKIRPREEVSINYDMKILNTLPSGKYISKATVRGWDDNYDEWMARESQTSFTVVNESFQKNAIGDSIKTLPATVVKKEMENKKISQTANLDNSSATPQATSTPKISSRKSNNTFIINKSDK